ncbi:MAG: hypothetical protein RL660_1824 [Bacteroidota bacterium]|jgi:hemoglobin/transferrin/lactoferrin receptor protein
MFKKIISLCLCIALAISAAHAQLVDSAKIKQLSEIRVAATKVEVKKELVVQTITEVSRERIKQVNANATGELLQQTGEVYLQKSQSGGGSPIIRGFEASRVLLVVDGVRMNNAIYRAGHLQNVITVDQNMLEKLEVLQGPASTMYGSDALGGVVVMQTMRPRFTDAASTKPMFNGSALVRYASAYGEKTAHADANYGNKKFAGVSSITYSDFGNVVSGKNFRTRYGTWGQNTYYAGKTASGADTTLRNERPAEQMRTGYSQLDLLQKLAYKQSNNIIHSINLQLSNSSNINRFDRLSQVKGNTVEFAEWYYGPQFRAMTSYNFAYTNKSSFLESIRFTAAHQRILETRSTRRFASSNLDSREETVNVTSAEINATHTEGKHHFTVGADLQLNDIASIGYRTNIVSKAVSTIDSRYPNGSNFMGYYGAYIQHLAGSRFSKFIWNNSVRYAATSLNSTIANTDVQFNLPYTQISQRTSGFSGSSALKYKAKDNISISGIYSSGFRAPNIDDMTKIFETSADNGVVVPNPKVKPERTHQLEARVDISGEKLRLSAGAYHTRLSNVLVLKPFVFNGNDSILYNDTLRRVLAMQNQAQATIQGVFLSGEFNLTKRLTCDGNLNLVRGNYFLSNDVTAVPLDHIPPTYGRFAMKYTRKKYFVEGFTMFSDLKPLSRYSNSGEDNLPYATNVGLPSWYTINLRGAYTFSKYAQVCIGVENIMDYHYRLFASGISAPGRNFIISVRSGLN